MLGQIQQQEWPRHVAGIRPNQVPVPVIQLKIAMFADEA
jgi:hypothetical protein